MSCLSRSSKSVSVEDVKIMIRAWNSNTTATTVILLDKEWSVILINNILS